MEVRHSPPPSYNEAIGVPPPAYTERDCSQERDSRGRQSESGNQNRVVPSAWTSENEVVVTQPRSVSAQGLTVSQPESSSSHKRGFSCNLYCVACKNKPCSCNGECFCYNCLAFIFYAPTCGIGTLVCVCCKATCPETCGDCPARNSSLNESYSFRNENFCSSVGWFLCGPICCLSCDENNETCPLATPCNERFGMSCIRRMTCYCGGSRRENFRCSPMDGHACGFLWDCKEIGCKFYN